MHENMKNFCCSVFLLMNIFLCLSPWQAEAACRNPNIVNTEGPSIVPAVASGLIEIRWFGHAFFQITSSTGTRIITEKGVMEEALSALA